MAWNEPGGGKDPWGGNRGGDGPPDIDEVVKKLKEKCVVAVVRLFVAPSFLGLDNERYDLRH